MIDLQPSAKADTGSEMTVVEAEAAPVVKELTQTTAVVVKAAVIKELMQKASIVVEAAPAVKELVVNTVVVANAPVLKELNVNTVVVVAIAPTVLLPSAKVVSDYQTTVVITAPAAKEQKEAAWWMQVPIDESTDSYQNALTLHLNQKFPDFFNSKRFQEWQASHKDILEAYLPLKKREELWLAGRGPRPLVRDYQRVRRLIDSHRIIDADIYDIEKELVKKGY